MGSIGPWEIIIILIVGLVLFGAKKLPEIGKSLGKGIREFKQASQGIKDEIENEQINNDNSHNNLETIENKNGNPKDKLKDFIISRTDITDEQKKNLLADLEK